MNRYLLICTTAIAVMVCTGIELMGEEVLTWHDCVSVAKRNHPDLISAREKINQKKAGVGIARSVLLPQINASVNRSTSKTEAGIIKDRTDYYSYGITGRQLLFDGFKSLYDVKQARKGVDVSLYEYKVTESDLRLNLRNAFVRLLKAQESLEISEEIVRRRRDNYNLVKLKYEAGREHNGALLTAKANLSQAEFEVARSMREISIVQKLMIKEMGLRVFVPLSVRGDFVVREVYDKKPDYKKLAATNPLLQEMIQLKELAEYGEKSAKLNFFPRVYGYMSAGKTDSRWPPERNEWSAGVEMSLPILQGGQRFYEVSRSKAEYKQLVADARSVGDRVLFTLEQKWNQLQNAIDYVRVQLMYLNAARERAKIAEAQYSIGMIAFNNWIIIEDTLVGALKSYLDAQANALFSEAEWIQSKGETLDYEK
jgi:outer membrane protein TolC